MLETDGRIMSLESIKRRFSSRLVLRIAIVFQIAILFAVYFSARTSFVWIWVIVSFIPATIIAVTNVEKRYVLASLLILFVSQQAVFIFSHPTWGYDYLSDSVNDLQLASIISENGHFALGQTGYIRQSYSYYPFLHIFSVALSKASGLSLVFIALYTIPILNALLTSIFLYSLNFELFGLQDRERNLATLLFGASYFYTYFQSQFVRETFAFPIVLLTLLSAAKVIRHSSRKYWLLLPILFITVVLSHHISSYVLLVILAIISASFNLIHNSARPNNRLGRTLLLLVATLASYVSFVVIEQFTQQIITSFDALGNIFQKAASAGAPPLALYDPLRVYSAYSHYGIIGALVLVGGVGLLLKIRRGQSPVTPGISLATFLVAAFLVCMALRFSSSLGSWGYYMALRGTIWAFIGISFVMAEGIARVFKLNSLQPSVSISYKKLLAILLIVCVIAAGKFSQYPFVISAPLTESPVTHSRYVASSWLKEVTRHGDYLLVAPETNDSKAFESAREMAAYAYLNEYSLDWMAYSKFKGYIPFVGKFFEQFQNRSNINIIYDNGETNLGYRFLPQE
jgi:hypothetical protein